MHDTLHTQEPPSQKWPMPGFFDPPIFGLVGHAHRPGQEKKKEVEEKARLATYL